MPTIVDFPTVVQEALAVFGDVFDTEAARRHFAEYLTGLVIAENKTVSGINRVLVLTTEPGDFTFDSYCTSAKVLNHIHSQERAYVGDLKLNRKVVYAGREQQLQEVASQIQREAKNPCGWGVHGIGTLANRCGFLT